MEVSLRAVVHLLLCVVVSEVSSADEGISIRHNDNFGSGLELRCFEGVFLINSGVSFQRNGVNISENFGGTLPYPLTPEDEGRFTCKYNGRRSNSLTLAGIWCYTLPMHVCFDLLVC